MLTALVRFLFLGLFLVSSGALCPATAQQALVKKRVDTLDPQVTVAFDPSLSRPHHVTADEQQELDSLRTQGVLADYVIETKINRSGRHFIVACDSGGSADFGCTFQAVQEGPNAAFTRIEGMTFEVPGDGCVYASGHNNTMFNRRRKFCLDGDRLNEISQPFHYVGLRSKSKRDLPFYTDLAMKRAVGTIKKGTFVEVLIAQSDEIDRPKFLVRDSRGLTGWISVEPTQEAQDIEGLYFSGD